MKNKRNQTKAYLATAYHEAGHAVVAWVIQPRVSFVRVTIVPGEDSLGHMLYAKASKQIREQIEFLTPGGRLRLESLAIVAFAGRLAQSKFQGSQARWGYESDYQTVAECCSRVCGNHATMQRAWSTFAQLRARQMVNQYWPEIRAVAIVLVAKKTLMLNEFITLFAEARGLTAVLGTPSNPSTARSKPGFAGGAPGNGRRPK